MDMSEAKKILAPKLNAQLANEWLDEDESFLWLECGLFDQNGIYWSINSDKGERLAEWVELELEKILS